MNDELEAEIRSLLDARQKIQAIKLYRQHTGASLADAKSAVDAIDAGESADVNDLDAHVELDPTVEKEIVDLLDRGETVQAVKKYHDETGRGLKQSKEALQRIAAERGIAWQTGSGCFGSTLLIVATGVAATVLLIAGT